MISSLAIARPLPSPVPQNIIDLADRSLDIGYKELAIRIQRVSAFHEGTMLLKEIGVSVYNQKSVERYKAIVLLKAKYRMHSKYLIYASLLCPTTYALLLVSNKYPSPTFLGVFFTIMTVIALGLAVTSLVAYFVHTISNDYTLEWSSRSLMSYDNPIPENVLRTALDIHEVFPKAEIGVEELRARRRVVDPFMYVVFKGVRLYVAVWNEPKFNGKML